MNRLLLTCALSLSTLAAVAAEKPGIGPGDTQWPVAWMTYRPQETLEKDIADLKAHGVGLIDYSPRRGETPRSWLEVCRRTGMKLSIGLPEITEDAPLVKAQGEEPAWALLIGGVYRGKAIDRHVFTFTAAKHEIIIEPPVYNKDFAYTRGSGGTGAMLKAEPIAHYFPDMPAPQRAEIIVPLKAFDGGQHMKVVPATIELAPADAKPENDTVTAAMPASSETKDRRLYRLSFDLSGLQDADLTRVGLAVYWPYRGTKQYWLFAKGTVSAAAESTRRALRTAVAKRLNVWKEANDGTFPVDVVLAARFGDECFYVTTHLNSPAVSYPLWDYSDVAITRFRKVAGEIEYPRTWGFPEIYGPEAYAVWRYEMHKACAELAGIVREVVAEQAPGLHLYRNTTRSGVFTLVNDHDGSGPELLTRELDLVHLDPYPVHAAGYNNNIVRDMSYYAGLARRYQRPLVPWMQAHVYGGPTGLQHPTPAQIDRMADEQYAQGVDAVMWLGYGGGNTFPLTNPQSWERAGAFHRRLVDHPPPKPKARLAVLRGYRAWSLTSAWQEAIRNPADWLLQQWLDVWAIEMKQPYDVFELPPRLTDAEREALKSKLKGYAWIVSNEPWPDAWVLGEGTAGKTVSPNTAAAVQRAFAEEIRKRGWRP